MKKAEEAPANIAWLIGLIALFLIAYVILLPEGEKEKLITNPGDVGTTDPIYGGNTGSNPSGYPRGTLLLSETPGKLYPYGQSLFVKPFASVNLFSNELKFEESLTRSLQLKSSFFSGDTRTFTFFLANPRSITKAQLLFLIQEATGTLTITFNGQAVFNGPVTAGELPITIPPRLLAQNNKITFSVSSGMFARHSFLLDDVSLFFSDQQLHTQEARDFVLSQTQLQNLDSLTLFYFVNCFTVQERGTLVVLLNGNLLSEHLVVCDAGEVSQDLPVHDLIPGRNILDFTIDDGKYVLEQMTLEGNAGTGRAPSYFFTLQQQDVVSGLPVGLDLKFFDTRERKVATVFVNGYPLYVDTFTNGFFFDITPYAAPGQNVIKIIPQTELDIVDLTVFMG